MRPSLGIIPGVAASPPRPQALTIGCPCHPVPRSAHSPCPRPAPPAHLQPLGVHGRRLPGGCPPLPAAGLGVQTHFPGHQTLRDAAGGTRGVAPSPLAAGVRGRSLAVGLGEGWGPEPEPARREPRGRTARATEAGILWALSASELWGHRREVQPGNGARRRGGWSKR